MQKMLDLNIDVKVYNKCGNGRKEALHPLRIGELAKRTNVSPRVLRYYEKKNLITSTRLENGYREYHSAAIRQVQIIQAYLNLGFTTDQISHFFTCVLENKEAVCPEVLSNYEKKISELDDSIRILSEIKANLEERVHAIKLGKQGEKKDDY